MLQIIICSVLFATLSLQGAQQRESAMPIVPAATSGARACSVVGALALFAGMPLLDSSCMLDIEHSLMHAPFVPRSIIDEHFCATAQSSSSELLAEDRIRKDTCLKMVTCCHVACCWLYVGFVPLAQAYYFNFEQLQCVSSQELCCSMGWGCLSGCAFMLADRCFGFHARLKSLQTCIAYAQRNRLFHAWLSQMYP
jgi:hypothetical protein